MPDTTRIVILGGGPGGYEAALVAADHGADVTIVCNEGLGGNSVLWDCVPSKAMIVSAEAMGWMQSAYRLGVRDTQDQDDIAGTASVNMAAVMDRVQSLAENQSRDITQKVEKAGVRYVQGIGRLSDRETVEVDRAEGGSATLQADVVLVATGSKPRTLKFSEPDAERVFTSRELFSLRELPPRLIVVGSGATGAEYAHAFARFGSEVHLISSREQVLPGEDPDAAAVIEDSFERWGAMIHRRKRAVDMERSADGVRVKVAPSRAGEVAPGGEEWVEGTHVLYCIGQVPYTDGLGLDSAGVEVQDNGAIPVDGVSRTNVRTIYAAGDVTGHMMLASVAAMQGRNAMWHALGQAVSPIRWDAVAACIFTSPEVASVGLDPQESDVPMHTVHLPLQGNPRAKMAEHTEGFVKIHAMQGSGTVLGGTVVSAGASDLIMPITVAVNSRLTVQQLAQTFSIYPSMSGSLQETARLLLGEPAGEYNPEP
ncbi:MAG: NAD(P)H-quinone dehydrogenase [Nitriliruptorales bacterium]|nr:NAD(P)H-quinone dehydrogenase [Nitriliruptorales bacterium]